MKNRKEFSSVSGCSGLVPEETQIGDALCLLKGMETPFVLRPTGQTYRVIGECYIEGYMKGRKLIGATKTFVLC